jgi:hypothetical protein
VAITALDLIKGSLRLCGAIATGEAPSASEASDALLSLNDLLDSWSQDGLMVYQTPRESFPLTPSKQTYTMGVGGDFNTARPIKFLKAAVEQSSGSTTNELPIHLITVSEWAQINVKQVLSSLPQRLYPDTGFPFTNINLWPIPNLANNLIIYSMKPLTSFVTVGDTVVLPPGYSRMIRYNLAVELAPEYGKQLSPEVAAIAMESKNAIQRSNTNPVYMTSDAIGLANRKPFNYLTGE